MTPARFRWGIILILFGLLLLLQNMNFISDYYWDDLVIFFSITLIAIGIEKIFTRTKLQFLSYASSFLILFSGLGIAFVGSYNDPRGDFSSESYFEKKHDDSVKKISANLEVDGTDLTIRDSGGEIVYASFDRFTRKPEIDYEVVDYIAEVSFISRDGLLGGFIKLEIDESQGWDLSFSEDIPLALHCRGRDSDVHLNMSTTPLYNLFLDLDESDIYLKLGDLMPNVTVKINGVDTKLKLRVPEHVGIKINAEGYESYFKKVGMSRKNGWYVSDGFDTVDFKVEIDLDADLRSFSIDYF
ncbi:MAG: hypothetical protein V3T75_06455 [candidate division Zixibacteria bacterium]